MKLVMTEDFLEDLKDIFGWKRKVKDAYWYIRGLVWDRYHIIKLRGIDPTYIDPREKFHIALFQIVDDYLNEEVGIKTYEERMEFLKRKKNELDEDIEKNDPCLENTRSWYQAYWTMIENLQWYKTTYELYRSDEDEYYRSIGINVPKRPKYGRVHDEEIGGYRHVCLEPEKEPEYHEFLKISHEAEQNLLKEFKERMKALVDVYDALWT